MWSILIMFVVGCAARPLNSNATNSRGLLQGMAAAGNYPNQPSCGYNSCGTSWQSPADKNDDYIWLANDVCNFIANQKGTCCCFADPYGQTKEVASDHPDWLPYMTSMYAQIPRQVSHMDGQTLVVTSDCNILTCFKPLAGLLE